MQTRGGGVARRYEASPGQDEQETAELGGGGGGSGQVNKQK